MRKRGLSNYKYGRRPRILDRDLCVICCDDLDIEGGEEFMLDETTILKAIDGDPDALASVIKFYEPVINKYSMRKKKDCFGGSISVIDPDVKKSLELSLIVAVMEYKVR